MFLALLLIFTLGFSLKDLFYEYLRSGYGNVADLQVKLNNLPQKQLLEIKKKIHSIDKSIDILFGYEDVYSITITDSQDSTLAKDMPILVKGLNFQKIIQVELDGKRENLEIESFEYDDNLKIVLNLNGLKVDDKDSIKFLTYDDAIALDFCTLTFLEKDTLSIESKYCEDDVDRLFFKIDEKNSKFLEVYLDDKKTKLKIVEVDKLYRTLVLQYKNELQVKKIFINLENIQLPNSSVASLESFDGELIVSFKRDENLELKYKRYIAKILRNYINYNRFVLRVKNYAFSDEEEYRDPLEVMQEKELVRLNELTDFLDMVTFSNGNAAVSSSYLAYDLNNLGILDNFTMSIDGVEFQASIRSTFDYAPERIYDKNILIFNKKVLENELGIGDANNFIDIYAQSLDDDTLTQIKKMLLSYDAKAKFIIQEEIIPSIGPKKRMFNIVVVSFSLFIFGILFIAMYVVLRQFYSNFESELALLKLFGLNHPFQTYINSISFLISAVSIYFVLRYEENSINSIMMQYFFTRYDFDIKNYSISLIILAVYILIIYFLERVSMKKLNLIKGQ